MLLYMESSHGKTGITFIMGLEQLPGIGDSGKTLSSVFRFAHSIFTVAVIVLLRLRMIGLNFTVQVSITLDPSEQIGLDSLLVTITVSITV